MNTSELVAKLHRRAWRTKQRTANLAPLSTKVRHKGARWRWWR